MSKVKLVPTENITNACCNCSHGEDEIYAGWCEKHGFTISEDNFYGCRCCDWEEGEHDWW